MEEKDTLTDLGRTLQTQLIILGGFIVFIWFLEGIDFIIGNRLDHFGIYPRDASKFWTIFTAPFLHVGFGHVAANTIPFFILGLFVLLRSVRAFFLVSIITILISGLGTWLIGPANTVHLGASGLVFGYFGYLLFRGYFEKSWESIIWAVVVAILYGSMLFGLIPHGTGISWQMHLFGFLGGGLAAFLLANGRQTETEEWYRSDSH